MRMRAYRTYVCDVIRGARRVYSRAMSLCYHSGCRRLMDVVISIFPQRPHDNCVRALHSTPA